MKRCVSLILILALVALAATPTWAGEEQPQVSPAPQTILTGLLRPQAMAMGDRGEIYILDGLVLKKYENGQLTTVASMADSREYFAPYGLGELEDIYSFRVGSMVYLNGALYVTGLMVDRLPEPKPTGYWNYGFQDYELRRLGYAMPVVLKITDHFEPIVMDDHAKEALDIHLWEYKGLMLNDPDYTQHWMYMDYTTRFRNLTIPNLTKSPDGALYVIKQTAVRNGDYIHYPEEKMCEYTTVYTDHRVGKLRQKYDEIVGKVLSGTFGLYKVYPDGRQEMLDELVQRRDKKIPNQVHISQFVDTYKKALLTENDPFPDKNLVYAVPSETDPQNSVIVTNGHFLWQYNFRDVTYRWLDFIPGNEMPSGNREVLFPEITYSPTMPRTTRTLGTFFLGHIKVAPDHCVAILWRLYGDRFYQDLGTLGPPGSEMPWIDKVADWLVDEDNRLIYYVTRSGELCRVSFEHRIPKTQKSSGSETPTPGLEFRVMYDKNRQYYYWDRSRPFYKDGRLYVQADLVAAMLGIEMLRDLAIGSGEHQVVLFRYRTLGTTRYLRCLLVTQDGVTYLFAPADDILQLVYELTGQRYTWRYDPPTNTLYLESVPGSVQLFNGRWW